jgi:hypothetical protein
MLFRYRGLKNIMFAFGGSLQRSIKVGTFLSTVDLTAKCPVSEKGVFQYGVRYIYTEFLLHNVLRTSIIG